MSTRNTCLLFLKRSGVQPSEGPVVLDMSWNRIKLGAADNQCHMVPRGLRGASPHDGRYKRILPGCTC